MEIAGIKRSIQSPENKVKETSVSYYIDSEESASNADGDCIIVDSFSFDEVFSLCLAHESVQKVPTYQPDELFVFAGGWQSWSAGWELAGNEKLPRNVKILSDLILLTNRPDDNPARDELLGHFIMYLRIDDAYFCIASLEGNGDIPPLTFRINRKKQQITIEAYCPGKNWNHQELLASIKIFSANGFFALKDSIAKIYQQEDNFKTLSFLSPENANGFCNKKNIPGGYASWYNHYNKIDEKIILQDLHSLNTTENLIKLFYIDRKKPVVFQIDDGWENCVGEWEIDRAAFPNGLNPIVKEIDDAGYIPGLWIAPFLVTKKCKVFCEKPEWVLRDKKGKPVVAGFNPLWDGQHYCLDLSRGDVLDYLKHIIDRAIDDWGFRYLKLDFLYAGMFKGKFANPASPYEVYDRACKILTKRTQTKDGLPVAYLGCGLPLGASYKYFPLSRIGADTREMWDWNAAKMIGHVGRPSAYINLLDTIGRSFMDNSVYINDPDVVFLRSKNCTLNAREKELIALVNFLLAGQIMFSDDPINMQDDDVALTKKIVRLYDDLSGDEYGATRIAKDIFRLESRSEKICGIINLSKKIFKLTPNIDQTLFTSLSKNNILVDNRCDIKQNEIGFLPHTISINF
ncbi:MAG: alpha-galactosidase [Treponema sp.]|nr:alpha-galactosidase [Treponema sp.]